MGFSLCTLGQEYRTPAHGLSTFALWNPILRSLELLLMGTLSEVEFHTPEYHAPAQTCAG